MTQVVDRTQEKIALAKELGLKDWVRRNEIELLKKSKIQEFTSMNFVPTDEARIKKQLLTRAWHGWGTYVDEETRDYSNLIGTLVMSTITGVVFGGLFSILYGAKSILIGMTIPLAGLAIYALTRFKKTKLRREYLSDWEGPLPYGALLAVKEAKEKGLQNFKIYFPIYDYRDEALRFKADPVITAYDSWNTEYEIFAWDDRKVYE